MEQIIQLKSFGARLRVKDGLLEVMVPDMSGAGNHTVHAFPAQHVKTILINRLTSVSSDALLLAHHHDVDIFLVSDFDLPEAFIAPLQAPPSILLWQKQLALVDTPSGLSIARHWLVLKVERKIEWLSKIKGYRSGDARRLIEQTLHSLRDLYSRLKHLDLRRSLHAADTLRGMEGAGNRQYLDTLARLLPDALRFSGRSRRPAADIFNAALNYAFGILYRWTEKALWASGLNPYIGYLHSSDRKGKSLLFDIVEAFRPWVEKIIFNLCSRREMGRMHTETQPGGLRLNDEGCRMVREAITERFDQPEIRYHGRHWTLRQGISLEARKLAAMLRRADNGPGNSPDWAVVDRQCIDAKTGAPCAVCYEIVEI